MFTLYDLNEKTCGPAHNRATITLHRSADGGRCAGECAFLVVDEQTAYKYGTCKLWCAALALDEGIASLDGKHRWLPCCQCNDLWDGFDGYLSRSRH